MGTHAHRTIYPARSALGRLQAAAALLFALSASAACNLDEIIQVEPPDRVTEDVLNDPAQASLLVTSAQGTFECAYGGYALGMGWMDGELNSLGNTTAFSYDRRDPQPAGGFVGIYANGVCDVGAVVNATPGIYPPLSSARWFAEETVKRLEGWTDQQVANRQSLIATAAAYAGYSLILLGESMCSIALDGGPELLPPAVFALAEERFNKAITVAQTAGNTDILNTARVGRARTRLNLGKNAEAVADAQLVPINFVKNALRAVGNAVTNNQVFISVNLLGQSGAAPNYWDVRWLGTPDPRVKVVDLGLTTLGVRRVNQLIYASESAPIPLATWEEAQLIIAEITGGQTAVGIIDAIHTKYGLAASGIDPNNAAGVRAQVIEERRRQFFLTGHRVYDILRYNLPLDPPAGSPYRWGGVHGSARCLPIPDAERNANVNF